MMEFRKFRGPRPAVAPRLDAAFACDLVARAAARGGVLAAEHVTIRLARSFGFCYGVERAVRMAFETARAFPDRKIYLLSELVHNLSVHRELGMEILNGRTPGPDDVVIVPAFGATIETMQRLRASGATIVDTTCGAVLSVWTKVKRYARLGVTSIIHGKPGHEEAIATASRAGRYVIVRGVSDAAILCRAIEGDRAGLSLASSPDFDPERHLEKIGLANQTTMLAEESIAIQSMLSEAMARRYGEEEASRRFFAFDTICSATQERQDALRELIESRPDVVIVVGGRNSSNTGHLAELAASLGVAAFHVSEASDLIGRDRIRHRGGVTEAWWPNRRPAVIGVSAGASTPASELGRVLEKLLTL